MDVDTTAGSEEDPVVSEVDVFLSQSLANHLYIFQYPLRPAHLPFDPNGVLGARMRPEQQKVELDVAIHPRGENYSSSRGDQYAQMIELGKGSTSSSERYYESGKMDKHTFTSPSTKPQPSGRYAAAVFKDNELHLTPLKAVLQLRPSLSHLDQADAGNKVATASAAAAGGGGGGGTGSASDGDVTESEGEEAKPVTVKFARQSTIRSKVWRRLLYQQLEEKRNEEPWTELKYQGLYSEEATDERRLLFAEDDSQQDHFSLSQAGYLDLICPNSLLGHSTAAESEPPSEASSPPTLPSKQPPTNTAPAKPKPRKSDQAHKSTVTSQVVSGEQLVRNARKKARTRLANDQLQDPPMNLSASQLSPTHQHPQTLPAAMSPPLTAPTVPMDTGEVTVSSSDDEAIRSPTHKVPPSLSPRQATPLSPRLSTLINDATTSGFNSLPLNSTVKQESSSQEQMDALVEFCTNTLGKGVLSFKDVKDRLLLLQSSTAMEGRHPLVGEGVSDSTLETALRLCGAVEVGQPCQMRLFALQQDDKLRGLLLGLFQRHKSLRKKQIIEEFADTYVGAGGLDNKALNSTLKELCYSRGGQWRLLGT